MARTGFMRDGHCTETNDDRGSHHICIDLSSTSGGNFCSVTGQPNWCESSMGCHEDYSEQCEVEHWCVCQWAFASYIQNAGGCEYIQDIVCEATNMVALTAYEANAPNYEHIRKALECLRSRCDIPTTESVEAHTAVHDNEVQELNSEEVNNVPVIVSGMVLCVVGGSAFGLFVGKKMAERKAIRVKDNLNVEGENRVI